MEMSLKFSPEVKVKNKEYKFVRRQKFIPEHVTKIFVTVQKYCAPFSLSRGSPSQMSLTYTTRNKQYQTNIRALSGIPTRDPRNRAAAHQRLRQQVHRDQHYVNILRNLMCG